MKFCVHVLTALRNANGEYLLRGDLHAQSLGRVTFGGTEFQYVRLESGVETFTAIGPLVEPIVVEVRICL